MIKADFEKEMISSLLEPLLTKGKPIIEKGIESFHEFIKEKNALITLMERNGKLVVSIIPQTSIASFTIKSGQEKEIKTIDGTSFIEKLLSGNMDEVFGK